MYKILAYFAGGGHPAPAALQAAKDTVTAASGVLPTGTHPAGRIGHAVLVLADLLPARRPHISTRKVTSPLSRCDKADPHRPTRSTALAALTVTISGHTTQSTARSATRRTRRLTRYPGPSPPRIEARLRASRSWTGKCAVPGGFARVRSGVEPVPRDLIVPEDLP